MAKKIKDGWHVFYGVEVYVENGKVLRGVVWDGPLTERPVYPYRYEKNIYYPTGAWVNTYGVSVDAYRAGWRRGTIRMM